MAKTDREIIRELAYKKLEYANSPKNEEILKKWEAQAVGKRDTPTVRLLFSNFADEVVNPRLQCVDSQARNIERTLMASLVGRELFDDDTPIAPVYETQWHTQVSPFGITPKISRTDGGKSKGFHIDPIIGNLADDMNKLKNGSFSADITGTQAYIDRVQDYIGDLLPVKLVMGSLNGYITNPLVHLMGMEAYFCAMYDTPDELHTVMDMATMVYEKYYDFLESNGLILPTNGFSPVGQETFAFTDELPTEKASKSMECWGFLESQETTAVSPEMYGEFVYPYQDRLVKRFGLLSYGCCERVDAILENYLLKWPNLRKLSVSPFNDEQKIGEYLRGTRIVYYSKPRAEFVTLPGPLDEEAIRANTKAIAEAASGCLLEVAQREVGTIFNDFNRGKRYVQLVKETIDKYWKP